MSEDQMTPEELERQEGEPLPERTQMSVISPVAHMPDPGLITLPVEPPSES